MKILKVTKAQGGYHKISVIMKHDYQNKYFVASTI